jgi:hypothetical protein
LLQLPAAGKLPKDIVNLYPPGLAKVRLMAKHRRRFECRCRRWLDIVNDKPAAAGSFIAESSLSDNVVYIDEELNFLSKNMARHLPPKVSKAMNWIMNPICGICGHPAGRWHARKSVSEADHDQRCHAKNLALAKPLNAWMLGQTFGPALSGYLGLFSLWAVWDGSQSHQPADWNQYYAEPYLTKTPVTAIATTA